MIQPAVPSVASSSPSLSGILSENGGQSTGNAGFAEVLAGQPQASVVTAATAQPEPVPAATDAALAPTQPNLAAMLPGAGKILPGALPDLVAGLALQSSAAETPATGAQDASPAQAIPTLLAAMRAIRLPQGEPAGAPRAPRQPTVRSEAPGPETGEADPIGAQIVAFALPVALPPATEPAAPAAAIAAGPVAAALPPLIEAQLLGRPLPQQPAAAAAAAAPQADDALALKVDPAAVGASPPPAIAFAAAGAAPTAAVRLRPVIGAAPVTGPDLATPAAASADGAGLLASPISQPLHAGSAPAAAPATAPATAVAPAATQPQDFAQLMDRLIAARDAAQTGLPQNVQIAVKHADFGPISVSFQHDQHGLAVSVASPDPDFARAVQAAIPAPSASAGADGTGRDPSGRDGAGQNGQPQGFARADTNGGDAGQRGARQARFDPAGAAPAANPSAVRTETTPAGRPRGVFA